MDDGRSSWRPHGPSTSIGHSPSSPQAAPGPTQSTSSQKLVSPWCTENEGQQSTRSGEMRHIAGPAEYQQWDFLKGSGPSAPPRVLVHTAKDVGRFKAGWHTKRAGHTIKADKDRTAQEQQKAGRVQATQAMRTQRLSEMNSHLGFNPITGDVRDPTRITSREEGIKCFQRPQTPPDVRHAKYVAAETRVRAREDLIRREGLAPRPVTVADNFKPEHYL